MKVLLLFKTFQFFIIYVLQGETVALNNHDNGDVGNVQDADKYEESPERLDCDNECGTATSIYEFLKFVNCYADCRRAQSNAPNKVLTSSKIKFLKYGKNSLNKQSIGLEEFVECLLYDCYNSGNTIESIFCLLYCFFKEISDSSSSESYEGKLSL